MHDTKSLKAAIKKHRAEVKRLKDESGKPRHKPECRAASGEKNFDYECNYCRAFKNYVQAQADLAAEKAYREHR